MLVSATAGWIGYMIQQSLQNALAETPSNMKKILLESAMDMIIKIQEKGTHVFRPEYEGHKLAFDREKLNWEFGFFNKHCGVSRGHGCSIFDTRSSSLLCVQVPQI